MCVIILSGSITSIKGTLLAETKSFFIIDASKDKIAVSSLNAKNTVLIFNNNSCLKGRK